jgi:hypothetical protein
MPQVGLHFLQKGFYFFSDATGLREVSIADTFELMLRDQLNVRQAKEEYGDGCHQKEV